MHWYDWGLLAIALSLAVGLVLYIRAATRATKRDLQRMVFPLVDALLTRRDDADDALPERRHP